MRARFFLLLALLAGGCGRDVAAPGRDPATIPPATFAQVVAELSAARIEALPDTAAYALRRREILDRAGVTAADLARFATARGADADVMAAVYGRVEARLEPFTPAPAGAATGGKAPPDSPPER